MKRTTLIMLLMTTFLLLSGWVVARALPVASTAVSVNEVSDLNDMNPGDGICDVSATAGDQCSLRAAIEELNALGPDINPHQIMFDMAGTGPFTITPGSALPDILVPVEIDGVSQPGAACPTAGSPANLMVVLDGSSAGAGTDGLTLASGSDGSLIRGLVIGHFSVHGIRIISHDNRIGCNHLGLAADGVSGFGNDLYGIMVSGDNNLIGGQPPASRNVMADNGMDGMRIGGENNSVRNNFIGTTADGMGALPNGDGVYISGNSNVLGGDAASDRNVISGNTGYGIRVNNGDFNLIQGNYIGVARDGVTPLPNLFSDGVELLGEAIGNVVGGTAVGEANRIAHNGGYGVLVADNVGGIPIQNSIRGNAIFNNSDLGIDLGSDGVDVNDAGDGDGGENEHQNYPVLSSVFNSTVITVALSSQANTEYAIDYYRNDSCDDSGYGEGQEFLITGMLMTDGAGTAETTIDLGGAVATDDVITAVATDPLDNSSEFSACVTITLVGEPTPTPTNTATPSATPGPSSTPGPSPTATATFTATPSPSPTPTAVPEDHFIYLPLIQRPND